ncbi:MAG: DUF4013 domain-containing protein [Planctomycetota bacterium]
MDQSYRMEIKDVASPTSQSPEARYQKLRKDVDQGMVSLDTWVGLVEACLELGKVGEAARYLPLVRDTRRRREFRRQLEQQGVVVAGTPYDTPGDEAADPRLGPAPSHKEPLPVTRSEGPRPGGTGARRAFEVEMRRVARRVRIQRGVERESVWEECRDAVEYLLLDAMPVRVLGLTLLFPAAVAIGFLLPDFVGEGPTWLLQFAPVLVAIGLFLGYAQKILLQSARGEEDPPELFDELGTMVRAGWHGFVRVGGLGALFLGPVVLAFTLGLPAAFLVVLAAAGLLYLPMALLGVVVKDSFEAVAPRLVGRGIAVDFQGYLKLALVCGIALSLPVIGLWFVQSSSLPNLAAVVGPLTLAPGLGLARLLGRYFYARAQSMRRALELNRSFPTRVEQERVSSKRAGLDRHDEKRAAVHDAQAAAVRHVEANAPAVAGPRKPVVAGPESPILKHRSEPPRRPLYGRPGQQRATAVPEGLGPKLRNHAHRPLRRK